MLADVERATTLDVGVSSPFTDLRGTQQALPDARIALRIVET
ncbi:hypothetical protein [Pseudonocardia sp. GCM10023141]